jgi:hypothetical protein
MKKLNTGISRRECITGLAAMWAAALAPTRGLGAGDQHPLRLAVSTEMLAGANVNDARTAYRIWIREISDFTGTQSAETVPEVFLSSEELIKAVRNDEIDCYGLVAPELAPILDVTAPDPIVLQDSLVEGIEYVLLVHNNSTFKKLSDLRGAQIVSHLHRDMVLLPPEPRLHQMGCRCRSVSSAVKDKATRSIRWFCRSFFTVWMQPVFPVPTGKRRSSSIHNSAVICAH